jgi:predicted MFS family arabinose efflux permease
VTTTVPPPTPATGLTLLRRPGFARLFAAYLVTYTGNAMAPIAIVFGVLEMTGSTRDSALVIAAPVAAQILVILLGGALADRTSRQRMIVGAEALAGISQGLAAMLFLTGTATVPLLAALMVVNGTAFALELPAKTGFVTQVVDRSELQAANALLGAARSAAVTLGAALAGVLVAWLGAGLTLAVDAATFLAASLLIRSIRARRQAPTDAATLLTDLRLGWREFTAHQWLWAIVLQFSILVAALEAVHGLLGPAVAKLQLGGPVAWGFIAASSGVGTIVGGLLGLRLRVERPMWFASWCVFFFAAVPLALAIPAPLPAIMGAAFVGGVAGSFFGLLWNTTLQTQVPAHLLSRVSAYDHLGSIALAPLGIVAGGLLFEAIGARPTLLIAGAAVIVPTIAVLFVPDVRRLRTSAPHPIRWD